jgi:hypothetical protein
MTLLLVMFNCVPSYKRVSSSLNPAADLDRYIITLTTQEVLKGCLNDDSELRTII